ncbi:MAG: U32 family peptidase [Clostridia bacterium]|nr:U32 family peptidase [Clostridia bacterium]
MCEILAPCGDKNTAIIAINSGADAIYLGLSDFSARESAVNFSFEDLKETINYAAYFGVKVYVAMNTLIKDSELDAFFDTIKRVWECGADAIILQDIFIGKYIKERCPQIVLHLSTQAGVCNEYGARLAKEFGFSRVILSRETLLCDIAKITKIIETEVFIQGALCTCFSGQCYLSSFIGGNSGNRGRCKQPCRKLYSIDREGYDVPAYRLSLSDLCVGGDIDKLVSAGVTSFKIEGRMRRPEYVAAAVQYYKNILGGKEGDLSSLKRTYNRGNYTNGLAFGQEKNFISSDVQGHLGEYLGIISVKNGNYVCHSTFQSDKGDCFKVLRDGKEVGGAAYLQSTKGGFIVSSDKRLKNGDKLFITTDVKLNERLLACKRFINVEVSACFAEGELPEISLNGYKFFGKEKLLKAESRALAEDDIVACFNKIDGRPFNIFFGKIDIVGKPYLGMGALNALRRDVYNIFCKKITYKGERDADFSYNKISIENKNNGKTAVISSDLNGVEADIAIYKPKEYFCDHSAVLKGFSGEKYLYLPAFMCGDELDKLKPFVSPFDGIYCEGTYGIVYARELGKPFFAGTGFNITNSVAANLCGAKYYCVSKELTVREAMPLCSGRAFYLYGGGIKVMDLIYCPFSKTCRTCDKRDFYTLTDGENRKFPIRRYKTGECRFELYNCANLVTAEKKQAGCLFDYTIASVATDKITRGHTQSPVK